MTDIRMQPPSHWAGALEELRNSAKRILKNTYISEGTRQVYSDILDWPVYKGGKLVLSVPNDLKTSEGWQAYLAQFNWDVRNFI